MSIRVPLSAAGMLIVAVAGVVTLAVTSQSEGGLGIPTENLVERPWDEPRPQTGTVHVAGNGCFHLDTADGLEYLVWPEGSRQDSAVVVLPGGTSLTDGDRLDGLGWVRSAAEVVDAADGPDGYMGSVVGFCLEPDEQVVVLQSIG